MNILQTVAVYVVIPGVIVGIVAMLTVIPGRAKNRTRYRPGASWTYPDEFWAGDTPVVRTDRELAAVPRFGGARGTW